MRKTSKSCNFLLVLFLFFLSIKIVVTKNQSHLDTGIASKVLSGTTGGSLSVQHSLKTKYPDPKKTDTGKSFYLLFYTNYVNYYSNVFRAQLKISKISHL